MTTYTTEHSANHSITTDKPQLAAQAEKNQEALKMVAQWLADKSGYEEEHGPKIDQAIDAASAKKWAR